MPAVMVLFEFICGIQKHPIVFYIIKTQYYSIKALFAKK
jgi:hypothetical protein